MKCEEIVPVNFPFDCGIIVSESLPNKQSEILRL